MKEKKEREGSVEQDSWLSETEGSVYEDNLLALGHDEELAEQDVVGTKEIIEKLAEQSGIVEQFNRVYVLHSKRDDFVACVNMKDKSLYINANQSLVKPGVLLRTLKGCMLHETLHINKFLGIPGTAKRGKEHSDFLRDKGVEHGVLNWIYDLEGHYQANERGFFNPIQELELREFLTATRTAMLKKDADNPLLALEHCKTDEHRKIKRVIEDRGLSVTQKAIEVDKILRKGDKGCSGNGQVSQKGQPVNGDGQGSTSQGEQKEQKQGEPDKTTVVVGIAKGDDDFLEDDYEDGRVNDITSEVVEEAEYQEMARKVQKAGGLNAGTARDVVKYYKDKAGFSGSAKALLKKLEEALKEMKGIDDGFMKDKRAFDKFGTRINGYRNYRDVGELLSNPEGVVIDGEVDINSVKVLDKVKRKTKGIMFILRDVSGSICSSPTDKVVRDATMFLISEAKRKKHRACVIDFAYGTSVIWDSKERAVTDEWEGLLCKSAMLKSGGGTSLTSAIKRLNAVIEDEQISRDIPITVFVITDTRIEHFGSSIPGAAMIRHNKVNVVGLIYTDGCGADYDFVNWFKFHKGKMFEIKLSADKKLIKDLKRAV